MIQTKDIIKDTFWEILEEKPYNKITVKDIVNRCLLSFCPFLSGGNFQNKQSMVQYLRSYHQGMSSGL